jgi:hypothetical protein
VLKVNILSLLHLLTATHHGQPADNAVGAEWGRLQALV